MKAVWTAIAVLALGSVLAVAWTARERAREQARPEAQIDARAPDAAEVLGDPLLHGERSALAVLPDAASAVAADSAAGAVDAVEPATFRIEARVVTLEGAPVAHPLVLCASRVLATGDELGVVSADVELALVLPKNQVGPTPAEVEVQLVVSGPGCSAVKKDARVSAGALVQLGTIALDVGAEVTGFVLDLAGVPLEGVEVGWLPAELVPADEEETRGHDWPPASPRAPPSVSTDVEGRFHLHGVPLEEGFVWAWPWSWHEKGWTEVFQADPGHPLEKTLRLEALPHRDACEIAVRVVTHDGAPAPGASVWYSSRNGTTIGPADDQGRSRWEFLTDALPVSVLAKDPAGRGYDTESVPVDCETREVVLRLGEPRWLEVAVRDPSGTAIESGSVRVGDAEPNAVLIGLVTPAPVWIADGVARLLRPRESFRLTGQALGYRTETFGPFAPEAQGEHMTLTLLPGQTVRGRVTSGGLPVAGAAIAVSSTFDPRRGAWSTQVTPADRRFRLLGSARWSDPDARTGDDGRFAVPVKADGWQLLRVEAPGFGIAVRGPFEWSRERVYDGVEVELERPGAIEGRVLVPAGDALAGHVVGACNGWAHVHTATSDVEGRFRIEGLDPGPWQLRPCKASESGIAVIERSHVLAEDDSREIEWDCEVRSGGTTICDVDLTRPFVIAGRLRYGGHESVDVAASVHRSIDGESAAEQLGYTKVAEDGAFELELGTGGPVLLRVVLRSSVAATHHAAFSQPLDLRPGRTEWNADIAPGALRVRSEVGEHLLLTLEWRGDENLRYQDALRRAAGETGDLVAPALPPGRIRIGRHVGKESVFWREVEVRSGEETVVDYP